MGILRKIHDEQQKNENPIKRYGKITITENECIIDGFHFNGFLRIDMRHNVFVKNCIFDEGPECTSHLMKWIMEKLK